MNTKYPQCSDIHILTGVQLYAVIVSLIALHKDNRLIVLFTYSSTRRYTSSVIVKCAHTMSQFMPLVGRNGKFSYSSNYTSPVMDLPHVTVCFQSRNISIRSLVDGDSDDDDDIGQSTRESHMLSDLETVHPSGGARVTMSEDGVLYWPVVFLYPEYSESDFISSFCENHTSVLPSGSCLHDTMCVAWCQSIFMDDVGVPLSWSDQHCEDVDVLSVCGTLYCTVQLVHLLSCL